MLSLDEMIQKYNTNGPRYTSYPPVPFWNQNLTHEKWLTHVIHQSKEREIELYIHVPFCEKLCYYCGCNRSVTKNHNYEMEFVHLILREWDYLIKAMPHLLVVRSIHFGGGTPTFLSGESLSYLLEAFKNNLSTDFMGSIEIDPRTLRDDHLDFIKKYSFKRVSLGIQDFDEHVQMAINRKQTFELVENVVKKLRQAHVESINFDVIYGLPKQSLESIQVTFEKVILLKPDMISFFSYAHLPNKMKNQRLIKEADLPGPQLKKNIYERGKEILSKNGYLEIGMDHFTLENGYLWKAKEENRLHRSFMGYTERTTDILIGLGPSAISDSGLSFKQNHKEYLTYKESINNNQFSIEAKHEQSVEDLRIQNCIKSLMCHHLVERENIEWLTNKENIFIQLNAFVEDGILENVQNNYQITSLGKLFVRNVAMAFDQYLQSQKQNTNTQKTISFSQTI